MEVNSYAKHFNMLSGFRRVWLQWAVILPLLLAIGCLPARAVREPYQPHYCNNAFTYQQEITEGRQAEQQAYKQMKVLPDSSPIAKYIQQLGAKLTKFAPGYKWPYRFHVVNSKDINAFALPGGAVFVNTGLIAAAQNESELAGVMAHEISHVVQRHASCNQTKQAKTNVGWGLAGMLAGVLVPGIGGSLAQQGIGVAQNLTYLRMSRTDEQEADLLGTEILYNAGYRPDGLIKMFQIIQQKQGQGGAQFLSDHPNPGNRVEYVSQEIAQLPPRPNAIVNTPQFQRIHAMVAAGTGLGAAQKAPAASAGGGGAAQGGAPAAAKSVAPLKDLSVSKTYTPFQHQSYSLSYPSNWKLYGDSGSIVTVAPQGGIQPGTNGKGQVAYGAIVDSFDPAHGTSIEDATTQLVDRLRQSNPQLREISGPQEVSVNQHPARSVELENVSPISTPDHSVPERDWLVTIERPNGSLNYLIFIAPENAFPTLHPAFVDILRSFHVKSAAAN